MFTTFVLTCFLPVLILVVCSAVLTLVCQTCILTIFITLLSLLTFTDGERVTRSVWTHTISIASHLITQIMFPPSLTSRAYLPLSGRVVWTFLPHSEWVCQSSSSPSLYTLSLSLSVLRIGDVCESDREREREISFLFFILSCFVNFYQQGSQNSGVDGNEAGEECCDQWSLSDEELWRPNPRVVPAYTWQTITEPCLLPSYSHLGRQEQKSKMWSSPFSLLDFSTRESCQAAHLQHSRQRVDNARHRRKERVGLWVRILPWHIYFSLRIWITTFFLFPSRNRCRYFYCNIAFNHGLSKLSYRW